MRECLVCREVRGEVDLPGGPLWNDELVVGFHYPPLEGRRLPYLGHLLVVTRRHADQWGDLTEEEAARVGLVCGRLAAALQGEGAMRVHAAVIGHVPHFHLHLLPRYPETPDEVPWNEVDEWDGARHGRADEVAALVRKLRGHVHSGHGRGQTP